MSELIRTASGRAIDMDTIRLANENTIAIGNMYTNAKGDELTKGGKVAKTRAQVMQEYYGLNTPVADDSPLVQTSAQPKISFNTAPSNVNVSNRLPEPIVEQIIVDEQAADDMDGGVETSYTKPRGSLADSVAQDTSVTQTLMDNPLKPHGLRRI